MKRVFVDRRMGLLNVTGAYENKNKNEESHYEIDVCTSITFEYIAILLQAIRLQPLANLFRVHLRHFVFLQLVR